MKIFTMKFLLMVVFTIALFNIVFNSPPIKYDSIKNLFAGFVMIASALILLYENFMFDKNTKRIYGGMLTIVAIYLLIFTQEQILCLGVLLIAALTKLSYFFTTTEEVA